MAYCTRADIEQVFGPENVRKWAELDGDANSTNVTNRIADAIKYAGVDIDDALRGGAYAVPFDPVPTKIVDLCRRMAAVRLYEARGVQDVNEDTGAPMHRLMWHKRDCEKQLKEIRTGRMRIDAVLIRSTAPAVVKQEIGDECH